MLLIRLLLARSAGVPVRLPCCSGLTGLTRPDMAVLGVGGLGLLVNGRGLWDC